MKERIAKLKNTEVSLKLMSRTACKLREERRELMTETPAIYIGTMIYIGK